MSPKWTRTKLVIVISLSLQSTIKQKSLMKENLQLLFDSTTKQARTAPLRGIEAGALNR